MNWPDHINSVCIGDCIEVMREIPDGVIQTCVTSPPYWGLRDYGQDGQLGLEKTPEEYVAKMVEVFREVRRILKDDGTLWLNLGDSYAANRGYQVPDSKHTDVGNKIGMRADMFGLKPKDLVGVPWMVAFALRADGWFLRQDIVWSKPNPMPESVRDRCTKAHEYIFLLSKSGKYYYDADAIKEPVKESSIKRLGQDVDNQTGSYRVPSKTNGPMKAVYGGRNKHDGYGTRIHSGNEDHGKYVEVGVNKRSVWTVTTQPYPEAHFATYPSKLIEPCIMAGSREGDIVLDPFGGSGTTAHTARRLDRRFVHIDLGYSDLADKRLSQQRLVLFNQ